MRKQVEFFTRVLQLLDGFFLRSRHGLDFFREMKSVESVSVNEEEIEDFSSVVVMKSYFACFLFRGVSVCQCGLYYMCGLINYAGIITSQILSSFTRKSASKE